MSDLPTSTRPVQNKPSRYLPESISLLLDVIRFAAALMVVFCHATQSQFHLGYRVNDEIGVFAVSIFFVLSGFVIRFVTRTRETTARDYFIDRASRIYSVVLPALAVTLVASGLCALLNPPLFHSEWAVFFDHPLVRLSFNLIFLSQAWGHHTVPFLNLPFWSLGYECIFYVLYGAIFFLRGARRAIVCLVVCLIAGPQVLFLFPIWYLGCWLYDAFIRLQGTRMATIILSLTGAWLLSSTLLSLLGHRALLRAPIDLLHRFARLPNPFDLIHLPPGRSTLYAFGTGVLAAAVLFILLLSFNRLHVPSGTRWVKPIRTIADGTFSVYLMHYPLMVLLMFAGLLRRAPLPAVVATLALLCASLVVAAVPMDTFKGMLRRWLRVCFPASTVNPLHSRP